MGKKDELVLKRTTVRRREWYNLPDAEKTSVENGVMQMNDGQLLAYTEMKERYSRWFERR